MRHTAATPSPFELLHDVDQDQTALALAQWGPATFAELHAELDKQREASLQALRHTLQRLRAAGRLTLNGRLWHANPC